MILLEEVLEVQLQQKVGSSPDAWAGGGRGTYQDQGAGVGEGGKPAFRLGNTLGPEFPSFLGLSFLVANLFSSGLWERKRR